MAADDNLMTNRSQRFDPVLRRWAKYDTVSGERINLKADRRPYARVATENPRRGKFMLHLALRAAKRKRADMAVDAKSLRHLAGLDGSVELQRWEKLRGRERTSVAVFADGSRVFFDRKGNPL